jgi:hypothetical protein
LYTIFLPKIWPKIYFKNNNEPMKMNQIYKTAILSTENNMKRLVIVPTKNIYLIKSKINLLRELTSNPYFTYMIKFTNSLLL